MNSEIGGDVRGIAEEPSERAERIPILALKILAGKIRNAGTEDVGGFPIVHDVGPAF